MHSRKRPNKKGRAKILIADTEAIFRLGLKKLFSVEDDLRVVAQAENSLQVMAMARSFRPDVALIQQEMVLNRNGQKGLLDEMQQECATCLLLITASRINDTELETLMGNGASGVIARSARPEAFVENIRKALSGEAIQPPPRPNGFPLHSPPSLNHRRPVDTLTPREKTIISCLTQGLRNRDIADQLTITEQTVKNHLRSIYDKIGVSDRLELVLYAIHQQLELPPVNLCN